MMRPTGTVAGREVQRLSDAQVQSLADFGKERRLDEGEYLFDEKGPVDSFYVVVEGEVSISRLDGAGEVPLLTHGPGEFTGGLAVLTGKTSIHRARAASSLRVVEIDSETFRRVAVELPEIADVFVYSLAQRMRITQRAFRQEEKLAALGRLSAGLAHELNNPASAARRATEALRSAVPVALRHALRHDLRFPDRAREKLISLQEELEERQAPPLDPLALGDREDALALWLEGRGIEDAWEVTPVLVGFGAEARDLEALWEVLDARAVDGAVRWLATALEITGLLQEVSDSTGRISKLVGAVKGYTYMDRSAPSGVDVVRGLEDTLAVMGQRLGGVRIIRDYRRDLPEVPGWGGELNQVWTNLLENAVDAVEGRGSITLRAFGQNGTVVVEVVDDGPGVPREIRNRVFEPFFTTKDVGAGAGLGLDVVRRTVADHGGEVSMESGPGGTTFRVRLPAEVTGGETPGAR